MNKNQRTRNEVSKLVEKRSGNKIYEWFTNYNFVDENRFDGYIFKDANLRAYFNSQPWYYGYRSVVPTSAFNTYEKANIKFLGKYDH